MATRAKTWVLRGLIGVLGVVLLFVGSVVYRAGFHKQVQMFLPPVLDEQAPDMPVLRPGAVLVFSKTNGFRHHEAIDAGNAALTSLAADLGRDAFVTENGAVFRQDVLAGFDVVIWNNASGTLLTDDQRTALQSFIEQGGGFIGVHAAGDGSHGEWGWYVNQVLRAEMTGHPVRNHLQEAKLIIENVLHPATRNLTSPWMRTDEWYGFKESPRQHTNVLISIDERSYDPERWGMGGDHPLVWSHYLGRGRIVYSAMGHTASSFEEPIHLTLLSGAMQWAADREQKDPLYEAP